MLIVLASQLLSKSTTERSALSLSVFESELTLSLLLPFCGCVHLDKISPENTIKSVPQQIIGALSLQLSERRCKLILHLEVCFLHLVLESSYYNWLPNYTHLLLTIFLLLNKLVSKRFCLRMLFGFVFVLANESVHDVYLMV